MFDKPLYHRAIITVAGLGALVVAAPSLAGPDAYFPLAREKANRAPLYYPALRAGGRNYVLSTDASHKMVDCEPVDAATPSTTARADCAQLTKRGMPGSVSPAQPVGKAMSLSFSHDPGSSLSSGTRGAVEIIFEIDEQGRVASCDTYRSSGDADMDSTACAVMVKRARYTPAKYEGAAVRAVGTAVASFRIP